MYSVQQVTTVQPQHPKIPVAVGKDLILSFFSLSLHECLQNCLNWSFCFLFGFYSGTIAGWVPPLKIVSIVCQISDPAVSFLISRL